jgi:cytochrome bd-type quinol oxidase subunit 1
MDTSNSFDKYNDLFDNKHNFDYPGNIPKKPLLNTLQVSHREASPRILEMYFAFIIFVMVGTLTVCAGELSMIEHCNKTTDLEKSFFYITIFTIVISFMVFLSAIYALIKRIGIRN